MPHHDWCRKACASCHDLCSLDENIPCSPDCVCLMPDGERDLDNCEKAGCDAYEKNQANEIILPVTWEVAGFVKIEAPDIEAAIKQFNETSDHIPLPKESEYVDGSFSLSETNSAFIKLFNQKECAAVKYEL